jgi:hypothetical protein
MAPWFVEGTHCDRVRPTIPCLRGTLPPKARAGPEFRTGGKIVEIEVVADPSRLRRLDLPILDD